MLYTAPRIDPAAQRDSEAVVLAVTRAAGSAFAPSANIAAYPSGSSHFSALTNLG